MKLPRSPRRDALALSTIVVAAAFSVVMIALEMGHVGDAGIYRGLMLAALLLIAALGAMQLRRRTSSVAEGASLKKPGRAAAGTAATARAEAAETANLAKSRYLANVSHEIRSPLNAIYGYAQLVERGEQGVDPVEAARVIRRCAEHLTSLVEGLLDISQVEHGVLRVHSEDVRFAQFLDQIVSMMRPAAAAKGIDLSYHAPERMPEFVRFDQSRFRQVLLNLLSNAIKYTDVGEVSFVVRYSGQIATFEVRDTGPGIRPEELESIFEPFERGDDAGKLARPGAGLGLSISRAIVEILGGNLEVESTPGAGTCFRVTMMLGEVAGKLERAVPPRRMIGHEGVQRTVLVVDDEADQRLLLERLLGSLGFGVTTCPNGAVALAAAQERAFDLAVLDISMPGMSGWEVARQLRQRFGQSIRILMLSANTEEFHKPQSAEPTHDHFLTKPVQYEVLTDTIGGLLDLTWRVAPAGEAAMDAGAMPVGGSLEPAATQHVDRLRELLRIGYIRGIEAEISALAAHGPGAKSLAERLFDRLDRFDLAGMKKELEGA